MVERLRLQWSGNDNCWGDARPIDFEKIALSQDEDFASPRKAIRANAIGGERASSGKKKGGILQRIGGRVLDAVEEAASDVIDKQTRKLTGDDEEEEEDDPKKN